LRLSLLKYWCRIRRTHHYVKDGDPLPVWGPGAVASEGSYRQIRRCPHCGGAYDTFAGFINEPQHKVVKKAA
jgi:hypothetical protein